ncbi:hypothetical protein AAGG74_12325 [Bacillus mexicanus]
MSSSAKRGGAILPEKMADAVTLTNDEHDAPHMIKNLLQVYMLHPACILLITGVTDSLDIRRDGHERKKAGSFYSGASFFVISSR